MAKLCIYLFCCFLVSFCVDAFLYPRRCQSNRIVGGYNVTIQDIPYQAYITVGRGTLKYACGASIVNERCLITAAHCLDGMDSCSVRVGSTDKNTGGTEISAKSFKCHPKYDSSGVDYDVGLIVLNEAIKLDGINTKAVQLADEGSVVEPGTNIKVSGWGSTAEDGATTETLMAVDIPTESNEECKKIYAEYFIDITERMICAGLQEGGKDSCQGDSGGPAVKNDGVQVGIVSFGMGCARPKVPGVYANVAALRGWIKQEMDNECYKKDDICYEQLEQN